MAPLDGAFAAPSARSPSRRRKLPWRVAPAFQGMTNDAADTAAAQEIRRAVEFIIREGGARRMTPAEVAREVVLSMAVPRMAFLIACAVDRATNAGASDAEAAEAVLGALTAAEPALLRFGIASERQVQERRAALSAEEAA